MKWMSHKTSIAFLFCLTLLPLAARAEMTEEWGIDRRGDDYRNFRAADLAQCQETCEKEVTCRAYTFAVGENTCYLKRGTGRAQRRSGRVSGIKQGPAAPAPAPLSRGGALSEEWGYDHPGHDYQTFQAVTLAVCKVTCREEERCQAYTYNHRTGLCYLKDGVSGRQPSQVHVTGAKGAARRPQADLTEERGYDYPGHDYHSFKAEELAVCQSACREEERCRAYSFNPRSSLCYLKEATGARETNPNTIAGTQDPHTAPPAASQPPSGNLTEEWGYDYRGSDYRSFRSPAYEVCRDTCAQEGRCRAYTFNQRTSTCYLKDRTGYRETNRDTVTGTKDRR